MTLKEWSVSISDAPLLDPLGAKELIVEHASD
jgi:hypothetical protein